MSKALILDETAEERATRLHNIRVANGRKRAAMPDMQAARSRGGKTRRQQEDYVLMCRKGFQTTIYRYPEFATWLGKKIGRYNVAKGEALGMSGPEYRRQRVAVNGSEGMGFYLIEG